MKKLLRHHPTDPRQLGLLLDFFSSEPVVAPERSIPIDGVDGADGANGADSASGAGPSLAPIPAHPPVQVDEQLPLPPVTAFILPPVVAAPPALPKGRRRIQFKDHSIDYLLLRSKRRSIGLVIDDDGLRVTAPRWVTLAQIEEAIQEKQRWILAKIAERRERSALRLQPQMQWRDGAALPYLGQEIILRIVASQAAGVVFDEHQRILTVSLRPGHTEQQLKDRVLSWLQGEAKQLFAARLPVYAEKLGVRYKSFRLSSAMTQWGSCTADGRIRLNWRLMFFGLEQIDYVIAHELSHLREMNHSPAFWATVQSVFPEFVAAKKVLRERGPETLPAF
ncbi:MAG: M48 family metallopeptidase [Janthinobacterium lividum]